jgi:antitoxin (DNA-binding transcriptional repressor) of toxin-antitoxin stability system
MRIPVGRTTVSLAEAKARLSELTELVASGTDVVITKRGKPVARLSRPEVARRPVNLDALRELTARMPMQPETTEAFMRRIREQSRY